MIDRQNVFDQPVRNDLIKYDNIRKIATGSVNDYTIGCLLDNTYFKKYYKMIAIDLSKQIVLDDDLKAIQQINFSGNLENNATIFFIIEQLKERILCFSQGTIKVF